MKIIGWVWAELGKISLLCSLLFWTTLIFGFFLKFMSYHMHVPPPENQEFLAKKALAINHRVVEGDLKEAGWGEAFLSPTLTTRDDFIGRYVQGPVKIDNPLAIENTRVGPNLVTGTGKAIVWISLAGVPPTDVATVDVGGKLDVCNVDGNDQCGNPYTVKAIACNGKDLAAATCSAAIEIDRGQLAHVLKALGKADGAASDSATPAPSPDAKPRTKAEDKAAATDQSSVADTPGIGPPIHVVVHHPDLPARAQAERKKSLKKAPRK